MIVRGHSGLLTITGVLEKWAMKSFAEIRPSLLRELSQIKWPNSPVNSASYCIEVLDQLKLTGAAEEKRKKVIQDLEDLVDNPGWGTLPLKVSEIRWAIEHLEDE